LSAKKTNEWVLNKAGVKRELLDTLKTRKLVYYGHTIRKQGSCLEKEIMQGTMSARCMQARNTTHGLDRKHQYADRTIRGRVNQNEEDIDKLRKSMVWPTLGSRMAKEQNTAYS